MAKRISNQQLIEELERDGYNVIEDECGRALLAKVNDNGQEEFAEIINGKINYIPAVAC